MEASSSDVYTLPFMKLKKHLLSMGIPKKELDKAPGKPSLLLLYEKYSGEGALAADIAHITEEKAELRREERHRGAPPSKPAAKRPAGEDEDGMLGVLLAAVGAPPVPMQQPPDHTLSKTWVAGPPERARVLGVVHITSVRQAVRNATVAFENGCDGVMLTDHDPAGSPTPLRLIKAYRAVRQAYPREFIGLNVLNKYVDEARTRRMASGDAGKCWELLARAAPDASCLWLDNAKVDERRPIEKQDGADSIVDALKASGYRGLYFGGVAFKGKRKVPPESQIEAASMGAGFMDVVTTSGAGTGHEPTPDKIERMAEGACDASHGYIGRAAPGRMSRLATTSRSALAVEGVNVPIGIASGVDPENVISFLEVCPGMPPYLIVSTGISIPNGRTYREEFDPEAVRALVARCYEYAEGASGGAAPAACYSAVDRDQDLANPPCAGCVRLVVLEDRTGVEICRQDVRLEAGMMVKDLYDCCDADDDNTRSLVFTDYQDVDWYPEDEGSVTVDLGSQAAKLAGQTVYVCYCQS